MCIVHSTLRDATTPYTGRYHKDLIYGAPQIPRDIQPYTGNSK